MDLGIKGKVALVAGASRGIGYAAAEALAREGARVVLASRNEAHIREAAERIQASTGTEAYGVALDIRVEDAGDRFVAAARERFGPPEILITNGGGPVGKDFASLPDEVYREAVELSFLSAVRLTRAALPAMREKRWGRIVHVSSGTVYEPNPDLFLSSAIRPAVAGFAKALAAEVAAEGVTVNLVCPGYIMTESLIELADRRASEAGGSRGDAFRQMEASVPMGRIGEPGELGQVIAFLCGEGAGYITGTAIRVDGGKVAFIL